MRISLFCISVVGLLMLSCSNHRNKTPEEFGESLVTILKDNDTLSFNKLQMKMDDLIQIIEDDQNATDAEKKIAIGILEQGGLGPIKTVDLDKNWNKRLEKFYRNAEKYHGISDWKKVKLVKVESKVLEEIGDKFMITIEVDYMGEMYSLKCHDVYKVSKKGFMLMNDMPVLRKI